MSLLNVGEMNEWKDFYCMMVDGAESILQNLYDADISW